MLEQFLGLHHWAVIGISIAVPTLVAVLITKLILGKKVNTQDEDATVLAPMVGFVGTAFTLLLAFIIVNVWSDQVAKQDVLFAEMTTIENILIESKTIDPEFAPKLKVKVLEYMDDVVKYEIVEKAPIGGNEETEKTFEAALLIIEELEADLTAQGKAAEAQSFFEETREWITDREMRVNKASGELDPIFTLILIFLALLTVVGVSILPATTAAWVKWAQSLGTAVAVGLVMGLVFYVASESFTRDAEEEQVTRIEQALGAQELNPVLGGVKN